MARKLSLENYRAPDTLELYDNRFSPTRPTGMMVEAWGGWQWETENGQYRTDAFGDGLWHWMEGRQEWQQIQGTGQFSLPRNRQATIRRLRRMGYELV